MDQYDDIDGASEGSLNEEDIVKLPIFIVYRLALTKITKRS